MNPSELQIIMLNNLAERARQLGDTRTAAEMFHQALQLISRHGASPGTEASVCTNFGILMASLGEHEKAIELQRKALELDEKSGARQADLGFSHHNLGAALNNAGRPEEGLEHLLKAARIRESIAQYDELVLTYEAVGDACLALGKLDEARLYAERGLALRPELGRPQMLRGVLGVLAEVAARKGEADRAVELHCQIIELLEGMRSANRELAKLDLFDSRYNKRYLDAIEQFLAASRHAAALALIDRTRFRSGCDAIDEPRAFASPLAPDALSLPRIKDDELMLVEWIYPKFDWSFAFGRDRKEIAARKIVTSNKEGPPVGHDLETDWPLHFEVLLRQTQCVIDAYRDDLSAVGRVIFFPHGTQWQAPFAALRNPNTGGLLLETHELLISSSLRFCRLTDDRAQIASQRNLVLGDPTEDLPGARREALSVARKLGCEPILGREVTKERVRQLLRNSSFNVIHYSGHGSYTGEGLHELVLWDGGLTARDVIDCDCSANLVNLASCWGGMTSFSIWNELHGFVRALLIGGVRNVIGSVYPLADDAAALFNDAFYDRYAGEGQHPVSAFRSAVTAIPADTPAENFGGLYITGQR